MLPLIPIALSLAPQIGEWLFGKTGGQVAAAATQVVQAVTGTTDPDAVAAVLSRDPAKATELQVRLAEIAAKAASDARQADLEELRTLVASDAAQVSTNNIEAASASLFVAGWRPAVGWVCVTSLAWTFIVSPMISWATGSKAPVLDTSDLQQLLFGLLGLAGMRTFEKVKGVTRGR